MNGRTAARTLHTKVGVDVVLVCAGKAYFHVEGIHIEFFADQRRQARCHALPHFRARGIKTHGVIGQDLHKRIGRPGAFCVGNR